MEYNLHFCIVSILYLSVIALYYRSLRLLKTPRVQLFSVLLCLGILAISLDSISASSDSVAESLPRWLLYVINMFSLACLHFCGVVLFTYVLVITGFYKNLRPKQKLLILLPFSLIAVLLLLSPFGTFGIFYLDESNHYHGGTTHFMLYMQMAVYLIACAYFIFIRVKYRDRLLQKTFVTFLAFALTGMYIQSRNPQYLITPMILTVGITIICFVFEAPSRHVDALTGAFNKSALSPCLKNAYNQTEDFALLVFSFQGFSYINHAMGTKTSDSILIYFSRQLELCFPKAQIFRTGGDEFTVLLLNCGMLDREHVEVLNSQVPRSMAVGESSIQYHFTTAYVNSGDCANFIDMQELLGFLSRRGRAGVRPDGLIGGEQFISGYRRLRKVEQSLSRALDENRIEVYFQPIHSSDGRLTSAEALMRIEDEEMGVLSAQECVDIAENNGSIVRLGEQVLERVCVYISGHMELVGSFDHISVNLSALQCVRDDLVETVSSLCGKYKVPERLISFEITETAVASLAATKQNMDRLIECGHCFFLDDFGTGYANFDHIAYLPFGYVKIDKSILWGAENSKSTMAFLEKTIEMLKTLGIKSICEGVETEKQARLLAKLGVTLQQGYLYSKPLPADKFSEYILKARAAV